MCGIKSNCLHMYSADCELPKGRNPVSFHFLFLTEPSTGPAVWEDLAAFKFYSQSIVFNCLSSFGYYGGMFLLNSWLTCVMDISSHISQISGVL